METNTKLPEVPKKCRHITESIPDYGDFLETPDAAQLILNYLTGIKDLKGSSHNFGYLLSMGKLKTLITKIDGYNDTMKEHPEKQVEGIRIYLARTEPVIPGAEPPLDEVLDNLVLMPVLSTGYDLYKVQPDLVPDTILGNPRPCPNECLALSFLK